MDRATSVIRYLIRPDHLEDLAYGLKGAFEGIDDLLGKVTPLLRKAMGIQDRQPQDATTSGSKTSIRPGSNRIAA